MLDEYLPPAKLEQKRLPEPQSQGQRRPDGMPIGVPFQKGRPGGPGRPKGIAAVARKYGDRAIEILRDALEDEDPRVRIVAAKELLDRGFGKSVQMTVDVTKALDEFDDDTLDAAISVIRTALSAPRQDDAGEEASPLS